MNVWYNFCLFVCLLLLLLLLLVEGVVATKDTIVKGNTLISHRIHRHEPPVVYKPIKFVHQDDQMVIIDKPSSIPVNSNNNIILIL